MESGSVQAIRGGWLSAASSGCRGIIVRPPCRSAPLLSGHELPPGRAPVLGSPTACTSARPALLSSNSPLEVGNCRKGFSSSAERPWQLVQKFRVELFQERGQMHLLAASIIITAYSRRTQYDTSDIWWRIASGSHYLLSHEIDVML
jgi:hypothetical protein